MHVLISFKGLHHLYYMNHNICTNRRGMNGWYAKKSNMHNECVYERESENSKT